MFKLCCNTRVVPAVYEPTPVVDVPTPVVDVPTPVVDVPTPVVDVPTPVVDVSTPVEKKSCSLLDALNQHSKATTPLSVENFATVYFISCFVERGGHRHYVDFYHISEGHEEAVQQAQATLKPGESVEVYKMNLFSSAHQEQLSNLFSRENYIFPTELSDNVLLNRFARKLSDKVDQFINEYRQNENPPCILYSAPPPLVNNNANRRGVFHDASESFFAFQESFLSLEAIAGAMNHMG